MKHMIGFIGFLVFISTIPVIILAIFAVTIAIKLLDKSAKWSRRADVVVETLKDFSREISK